LKTGLYDSVCVRPLFKEMAPSSKHSLIERGKFICFQCKGDMSTDHAYECGKSF